MIERIATVVVSLLVGGGGVGAFSFFYNKKKLEIDDRTSSVSEWKELYDEMKGRLETQEEENKQLKKELGELKTQMLELQTDIANYKQYDGYIKDLEAYVDHLLHTLKTFISDSAYNEAKSKRPHRIEVSADALIHDSENIIKGNKE